MAPVKVINASLGRTGTDSFCEAMDILGYNCQHMLKLAVDSTYKSTKPFYDAAFNIDEANMDELYADYDAAADWTGAYFYKQLFTAYPDAKVILTERSFEDWFKSMKNTIYPLLRDRISVDPDHPRYYFSELLRKIILDGYILDDDKYLDEDFIRKYYNDHNKRVKGLVPADQLYCFKLGEGWEGICAFLGKDVPQVPYPNKNSTAQFLDIVEFTLSRDDTIASSAATTTSDQDGVIPVNDLKIGKEQD